MAKNIIHSINGMLREVLSTHDDSRRIAAEKLKLLLLNIGYPSIVDNITAVEGYYEDLNFHDNDSYYEVLEKLKNHDFEKVYSLLITDGKVDRHQLLFPTTECNAAYTVKFLTVSIINIQVYITLSLSIMPAAS